MCFCLCTWKERSYFIKNPGKKVKISLHRMLPDPVECQHENLSGRTPCAHSKKAFTTDTAICCWPSQKLNYPCGNIVPVDGYSTDSLMNFFILLTEVTEWHAWQIHSSLKLPPLYILLISWIFQLCSGHMSYNQLACCITNLIWWNRTSVLFCLVVFWFVLWNFEFDYQRLLNVWKSHR